MSDLNKMEMAMKINTQQWLNKQHSSSLVRTKRGLCDPTTCCCGCSCVAFITTITGILGALGGLAYLIYFLVTKFQNGGSP